MGIPLRVLLVEDSEADAALVLRALERGGYEPTSRRIEAADALAAALDERPWDVILCDYSVPGFGVLAAFELVKRRGVDIPFIMVSGTIGEESAVACMRAGMHDFVHKDRLVRLAPAVTRELGEALLRRERKDMREKLRRSEETLARSEKLRALGEMAAGISHDLKNILNPLALHMQATDRSVARGEVAEARESIAEMRRLLARGVQTIERLREFSRQAPETPPEPVDLGHVAAEAVAIARPRMVSMPRGRMPTIREEHAPAPRVRARSAELVSAVVNLVVNAIDAMNDGGTITLRTGSERGGGWLEVADDGPGMPPEIEQRAFEPFFSTKGDAGTGLGLAMVYACARRYQGHVSLETAPGAGARFRLWFPASETA